MNLRKSLLPTLSIKEALLLEQRKPLWKHGTEQKQRYHNFEIDSNLVRKHIPKLIEHDKLVSKLLT